MENKCTGTIFKALSGFYYVYHGDEVIECRARGRFRYDRQTPLVGDRVTYSLTGGGCGYIEEISPRRNSFIRPPVANIDLMIIVASEAIPVTDPFLIDRVTVTAELSGCGCIVCINKCDLTPGDSLYGIYVSTGIKTIRTSAVTGEGIKELTYAITGKTCSFTGNSGVGKSSILNAINESFNIKTGDVSAKLGRGRHTTRHVELYRLSDDTYIADTPGFSSFDTMFAEAVTKEKLQYAFPEFEPYLGSCRYRDCSHTKEAGCAVLEALKDGKIQASRHESYTRLYDQARQIKAWQSTK